MDGQNFRLSRVSFNPLFYFSSNIRKYFYSEIFKYKVLKRLQLFLLHRLAYFERSYVFMTHKHLISEATNHYAGQAIKQAYVLVLGLDVIGNPYGLVVGTMKGIEDLFYEPFQGAIQGPGEFAEGLYLGVRSMLGHTVGGMAGAMSKITGAMGTSRYFGQSRIIFLRMNNICSDFILVIPSVS